MKKQILTHMIAGILLLAISCNPTEKKALLPNITGKPGEILLVIDKYLWESPIGEYFSETFGQSVDAIPSNEPLYDLVHIPSSSFTNLFKTHRNIILTKVSNDRKEPRILVQRDVWAKPQLVLNVVGPNDTSMINYLNNNREKLLELLEHDERMRTIDNYKKNRAKGIDEVLQTKHHLSITVPAGYDMDVEQEGFVWLSHEVADLAQGILIYYYDYADSSTFTPEFLGRKRDQITKKYVPGPVDGSYMKIESEFPLIFKEYMKNDIYTAEIRGLWRMEKAFMGGPFISISSLDKKRNRVVCAEGFVYAPSLDKRNYIRELEAILQTLTIID